jgi:hypothetical protein
MRGMADAFGVSAESLWLHWLSYEPPEPGLSRIADEISDLRQVFLDALTLRDTDAERQDWDAE